MTALRLAASCGAVLVACNAHQERLSRVQALATPRHVLLEGRRSCEGEDDLNLAADIAQQRRHLASILHPQLPPVHTASDAAHVFSEVSQRPLIAVFSGHARCSEYDPNHSMRCSPRARSELCFEDDRAAVDDLIALIPSTVPYAVVALNACYSANVDVRHSAVPIAVLSASPTFVVTESKTALGPWLIDALSGAADVNRDGLVDDRELLDRVWSESERKRDNEPRVAGSLSPKLRRQAWTAIPVLRTGRVAPPEDVSDAIVHLRALGVGESTLARLLQRERAFRDAPDAGVLWAPSTFWLDGSRDLVGSPRPRRPELAQLAKVFRASEGFALEPTVNGNDVALVMLREGTSLGAIGSPSASARVTNINAGNWARLRVTMRGTTLWHGGRVQSGHIEVAGDVVNSDDLLALPCEEAFGQCFTVLRK